MADIFNRSGDAFGGAMSADASQITFTGGSAGLLAQNLQLNYNQAINRIWEIESNKTYYIAGRSAGTLGIARIIGPKPLAQAFYTKFGDVCQAADNIMKIAGAAGCGGATTTQFNITCSNVVIVGLAWSITMAEMVMNQNISAMFNSLRMTES
tara:strand:- start:26 stop:484 length:459 start_codon:yes stop_codon:yes gene_type:complete